jgi:formylglycine-generating enzyme required for sulfatase activity
MQRAILVMLVLFVLFLCAPVHAETPAGAETRAMAQAAVPSARLCKSYSGLPDGTGAAAGMVLIPGGRFVMGSDRQRPEERFSHIVRVDPFYIDRHEVTNAQFARFADATGYVTVAERGVDAKLHPDLSWSARAPGSAMFVTPAKYGRDMSQWWSYVKGASWRHPEGPGSDIAGRENLPVVHIAYDDAVAYAHWLGHELPTEAQWEYAARGGAGADAPDWSSAYDAGGRPIANTWQGIFPVLNTAEDGYAGAAPVGCFGPNGYGLFDMVGNVWEWTSDWYRVGHARGAAENPTGPSFTEVQLAPGTIASKVIKGGSYLCSSNYCARYRPSARQPQEIDMSAGHVGFRTVLKVSGEAGPR